MNSTIGYCRAFFCAQNNQVESDESTKICVALQGFFHDGVSHQSESVEEQYLSVAPKDNIAVLNG